MTVGLFNTGMFAQDLAKKSFASYITRLMPNGTAPLFALTSMLNSSTALQVEHGFFTKTMIFPQLTIGSGGQLISDTIFTVTSTLNTLPNMLMTVASTGEQIFLNAIIDLTHVAVIRGFGGTAPVAIAAGVNLYQVGTAFEEGSLRPNPMQVPPVRITNVTQIFRDTWSITGSARATQVIAGDTPVAENKQDCAGFHATSIEKALIFGQKIITTRNGQPLRVMDGLINIVSNAAYYPSSYGGVVNVTTAGSTTNFTQFEAAFDVAFNQTTDPKIANERVLFVGSVARRVINNIGRLNGTYMMTTEETTWGLQFNTIRIARGSFRMIEHPLFNSNPLWQKYALAVDLSSFNLAYLGDRRTQAMSFNMSGEAAADNGIDAVGGTLTTELTCEVKNPPANALMTNLTAAAAG